MVLVSINRVNECINRADQRVTGGHASPPLRFVDAFSIAPCYCLIKKDNAFVNGTKQSHLTLPHIKKLKSNKLLISLVGLVMAAVPFTNAYADAHGETINIYGWQNWSYEFVDADGVDSRGDPFKRNFDRLSNNAANHRIHGAYGHRY